jgi:hypothetical protein
VEIASARFVWSALSVNPDTDVSLAAAFDEDVSSLLI